MKKKYNPSIKDRAQFKHINHSNERRTILTVNDNCVEVDADKKITDPKYTGGQI